MRIVGWDERCEGKDREAEEDQDRLRNIRVDWDSITQDKVNKSEFKEPQKGLYKVGDRISWEVRRKRLKGDEDWDLW